MVEINKEFIDQLLDIVNIDADSKVRSKQGYGKFSITEAFIDNPEDKEMVNHKDCIKTNNTLENLEWVTHEENMQHAIDNNRQRNQSGENNNMSKLSENDVLFVKELLNDGLSAYEIHKDYFPTLHQQTIYAIKQKRIWNHI